MQRAILLVLAAIAAVALAEGQYYVPRAYYVIDAEGHASAPVPLRRLRRSVAPYPGYGAGAGADANANANANAYSGGGDANANANANAYARGNGGWDLPGWSYGASNPRASLSAGESVRQFGPVVGRSVSASTSVGVDSYGKGYYDQYASVSN